MWSHRYPLLKSIKSKSLRAAFKTLDNTTFVGPSLPHILQTCHSGSFPILMQPHTCLLWNSCWGWFALHQEYPAVIFAYYNLTTFERPAHMLPPPQNLVWLSQLESISPSPGSCWRGFTPVIAIHLALGLVWCVLSRLGFIMVAWAFLARGNKQVTPWL